MATDIPRKYAAWRNAVTDYVGAIKEGTDEDASASDYVPKSDDDSDNGDDDTNNSDDDNDGCGSGAAPLLGVLLLLLLNK